MFSVSAILILSLLSAATAVLSALTGMAGGLVLLVGLSFFFPASVLVPFHGAVQLANNGWRILFLRSELRRDWCAYFFFGCFVSTAMMVKVFREIQLPAEWFYLLMGLSVSISLFRPKNAKGFVLERKGFAILGFLAGAIGPLVGSIGPFLASFFLREDLSKKQIVANKSFMQSVVHLGKIPVFYSLVSWEEMGPGLIASVFAGLVGTRVGLFYLRRVSARLFLLLFRLGLAVGALRFFLLFFRELNL